MYVDKILKGAKPAETEEKVTASEKLVDFYGQILLMCVWAGVA
ncbi:MAG: hypothetical protein ACTHLX_04980 [Candidatus Binatia bacterium]